MLDAVLIFELSEPPVGTDAQASSQTLFPYVLDGMYFCMKNMSTLQDRPEVLTHDVFDKIFSITEILNMDEDTRSKIGKNMTTERDFRNQLAYARKEGREEERRVSAAKFKALGVDIAIISQATGLSEEEIAKL